MEFCILGPLEIIDGERHVVLPPKLRDLLAALVCRRGVTLSADRLSHALWGDALPPSAGRGLPVYVHRLRREIGDETRVVHRATGYALEVRPGELDADRCEALVAEGRSHIAAGRVGEGANRLREALALWRGSAFEGQEDKEFVRETVAQLSELRHVAHEELIDAELALGRHAAVVGELRGVVLEHPFREHPRAQLMLALYRLGRHSEALDVYRDGRRLMIEEIGLEPGLELRDLQDAILRRDPALDHPAPCPPVVPAEPPRGPAAFTGRAAEVKLLRTSLAAGPRLVAINGPGGVGKSALAVHAADRLAGSFPDGRLYADLRGSAPFVEPLSPGEVLGRFLRALMGDGGSTPLNVDEAAARFRSRTAGRRILVILDDACDAEQVRPLLPGGPEAAVIVTSRRPLATLDGARHLRLGPLDLADAVALLGRLVGPDRVTGEPEAAARIVRLCDTLPLAVRIAAARLTVRRDWTLTTLAERLAGERDRLDELRHDELAVRTCLAGSVRALDADAARLFALLGVFDGPHITAGAVAALNGGTANTAIGCLLEAHLIDTTAHGYRMHDLVRIYSREQAESLPEKERSIALSRILHHYLDGARRATVALDPATAYRTSIGDTSEPLHGQPDFSGAAEALEWLDAELDDLLTATRQAAATREHAGVAVGLATALFRPFAMRRATEDQAAIARLALAAAQCSGDPASVAYSTVDLGTVHLRMGRIEEAIGYLRRAHAMWRTIDDPEGEFTALTGLGIALNAAGRPERAAECFERGLEIYPGASDRYREALALANLGCMYQKLGRFDEAIELLNRSRMLSEALEYVRGDAMSTGYLANTYVRSGRPERAIALFERAIAGIVQVGDRITTAEFLWGLGQANHELGRHEESRSRWHEALTMLCRLGVISDEEAKSSLDVAHPKIPEPLRAFA